MCDVFIEGGDYTNSQIGLITDALNELSKKSAVVKFRFHSSLPLDGRPFLNIRIIYVHLMLDEQPWLLKLMGKNCISLMAA